MTHFDVKFDKGTKIAIDTFAYCVRFLLRLVIEMSILNRESNNKDIAFKIIKEPIVRDSYKQSFEIIIQEIGKKINNY